MKFRRTDREFPDFNFDDFPNNLTDEQLREILEFLNIIQPDSHQHEPGKIGRKEWVLLPYRDPKLVR